MKKPLQQDLGGSKAAVGEERRRSQRVMIRMPVTLRVTVDGKELTLPAFTVSVNDHGAMLMCGRGIPGGTKLELRNEHTGETQTCRVTRTADMKLSWKVRSQLASVISMNGFGSA